jgi:hypothetical protein
MNVPAQPQSILIRLHDLIVKSLAKNMTDPICDTIEILGVISMKSEHEI